MFLQGLVFLVEFDLLQLSMMRSLCVQGLVFLVDASDGLRLDEARRELAGEKRHRQRQR